MRGGRQGPDRRVRACECKRASRSNLREDETLELEAGMSALREHETRISFAYKRQKESPTAPARRIQRFQQSDDVVERASCLFGRDQIARRQEGKSRKSLLMPASLARASTLVFVMRLRLDMVVRPVYRQRQRKVK
jgi:hypothetical protein